MNLLLRVSWVVVVVLTVQRIQLIAPHV